MAEFFTTSEIAEMYGLADSTVRHYRASGRLVPSRKTPGGHARYTVADVLAALGEPETGYGSPPLQSRAQIVGIGRKSFAPVGQHDMGSSGRGGVVAPEVLALGQREIQESAEPPEFDYPRWGGRLLKAHGRVAA